MTKKEVEIVNELFAFIDEMFAELNSKGYCYCVRKMMRVWDEFKNHNVVYGTSDYDALEQENDELREQIDELEQESGWLKCDVGILKKKCHKLEEMTKWHKFDIKDESTFPPEHTKVLFIDGDDLLVGFMEDGWFTVPIGKINTFVYRSGVVAWRELPEAPNFKQKG